jgi:hypothetical protein
LTLVISGFHCIIIFIISIIIIIIIIIVNSFPRLGKISVDLTMTKAAVNDIQVVRQWPKQQ